MMSGGRLCDWRSANRLMPGGTGCGGSRMWERLLKGWWIGNDKSKAED